MRSGKVTIAKEDCDTADLRAETAEVMRALAEQAGVTLSIHSQPIQLSETNQFVFKCHQIFSPGTTTIIWPIATFQDNYVLF